MNSVLLTSPSARKLPGKFVPALLDTMKNFIEIERFDYNSLPEAIIHDFVIAANKIDSLSVKEITKLMEEKIVPPIQKILVSTMEVRAGEYLSPEKKVSFLATKAKESGITLEEIEKVMNSSYIYLPFLNSTEREVSDDGKSVTWTIKGGIIWFKVKFTDAGPKVVHVLTKKTWAFGTDRDENEAFGSAALTFARNLQTAMRGMDGFKLTAPIKEVSDGEIKFALGKKEGIKYDDPFWVGQWEVDEKGELFLAKDGWVRVKDIADNKENSVATSSGYAISQGIWAPEMLVIEHARLRMDVAVKPGLFQMDIKRDIKEGAVPMAGGFLLKDYSGFAIGTDLDFHINLAPATGWLQTFALIGLHASFSTGLETVRYSGGVRHEPDGAPTISNYAAHIGMFKRYYMGRKGFDLEAKVGYKIFSITQTYGDADLVLSNHTICFSGATGVDYAYSPDINIGVRTGFQFSPAVNEWNVNYDGEELGSRALIGDPKISHTGLIIGLYVHYTPASLPFDPMAMIKNLLP